MALDLDFTPPNFTQILTDTVGNAGDDSDGFPQLLAEFILGIAESAAIVGLSILDIADAVKAFPDGEALTGDNVVQAAGDADTDIGGAVAKLDALMATIIAPPTPPSGGPGTGPPPGGGPPAGYTDQIDFGTIKAVNGLGNSAKVNYVYDANATQPYTLRGISREGSVAFQFSYGSFPVHVTVGKPPIFGVWVQNIMPGEYTGALDIGTDQPGGGGRVFLHVIVTK